MHLVHLLKCHYEVIAPVFAKTWLRESTAVTSSVLRRMVTAGSLPVESVLATESQFTKIDFRKPTRDRYYILVPAQLGTPQRGQSAFTAQAYQTLRHGTRKHASQPARFVRANAAVDPRTASMHMFYALPLFDKR